MKATQQITEMLQTSNRFSKINLIKELDSGGYQSIDEVFSLARKTDAQVDLVLRDLYSVYMLKEALI